MAQTQNSLTITDLTEYYTFVRYSQYADGHGYVVTPTSDTKYIGIYVGELDSPPAYNNSGWKWSLYQGRGVASVVTKFINWETNTEGNKPTTSTSGWNASPPVYNSGKPYYYVWTRTNYNDGSTPLDTIYLDNSISDALRIASEAQNTANNNIKVTTQLWYLTNSTTAPNVPTAGSGGARSSNVLTRIDTQSPNYTKWYVEKPAFNSSSQYRYYFYCYETQKGNDTYSYSSQAILDTSNLSDYEVGALNVRTKNFFKGEDNTYDGWFASGRSTDNGLNTSDATTYQYNARIAASHIALGYNKTPIIDLDGTNSSIKLYHFPTISNGVVTAAGALGMELNPTSLNFYGSSTSIADATLTSTGLKLVKGGIDAGTSNTNNYVYISSENGPRVSINGYTPGTSSSDPQWRGIIGTKFGVLSDGTLYASNVNIKGTIDATSFKARDDNQRIRAEVISAGLLIYDDTGTSTTYGNQIASFGSGITIGQKTTGTLTLDSSGLKLIGGYETHYITSDELIFKIYISEDEALEKTTLSGNSPYGTDVQFYDDGFNIVGEYTQDYPYYNRTFLDNLDYEVIGYRFYIYNNAIHRFPAVISFNFSQILADISYYDLVFYQNENYNDPITNRYTLDTGGLSWAILSADRKKIYLVLHGCENSRGNYYTLFNGAIVGNTHYYYNVHNDRWTELTPTSPSSNQSTIWAADGDEWELKLVKTSSNNPYYISPNTDYGITIGTRRDSNSKIGYAIGSELMVQTPNSLVIGRFNNNNSNNAFEIGNGADGNLSNALTVDWNGNVDIASGAKYKVGGTALQNAVMLITGGNSTSASISANSYGTVTTTATIPSGYIVVGVARITSNHYSALRMTGFDLDLDGKITVQYHNASTSNFTDVKVTTQVACIKQVL